MADVRQTLRARTSSPVVPVGGGLVAFGVANFAFLALSARDLGPAGSAPVSVFWTVVNAFGIGLFMPLEQDLARRLAAARARGGTGRVGRAPLVYTLGALAVVAVVLLVAGGMLGRVVLDGQSGLVWVVLAALAAQAVAYATRGLLAGEASFGRYGAQLALDGALRTVGSAVLAATGNGTAVGYGLVLVAAPVLASGLALLGRRPRGGTAAGAPAETPSRVPFGALVSVSLLSQVLANAGPMLIAWLAEAGDEAMAGRFVAAVTVARIPLFAFAAVQAVVLPALAARSAAGDVAGFRATTRLAVLGTAGLGAVGALGVLAIGPFAQVLLYGEDFAVSRTLLFLVAVSGAFFMMAQVLAIVLLSRGDDWAAAVGWGVGVLALGLGFLVPTGLAEQVALALCTGAAAAAVCHAVRVRTTLRRWEPAP